MQKLLTLVWRDTYTTFIDRNLLLLMFATPLALSTIIGLAFSGIGGGGSPSAFNNLPVAVVNMDAGEGGQDYGDLLVNILVPSAETPDDGDPLADSDACELTPTVENESADGTQQSGSLDEILNASLVDSEEAARMGVDTGDYIAAIIIPESFSAAMNAGSGAQNPFGEPAPEVEQVTVAVYGSSAAPISSGIVRSIVDGITQQFVTSSVTVASTIETITSDPRRLASLITAGQDNPAFDQFGCAFVPGFNTITIQAQPLDEVQASSSFVQILVQSGSAQATFFALFSGLFGLLSIYDDRKNWTLQRLIMTPTPRAMILGGKVLATFLIVFLQLLILLIALMAIASIIEGELVMIWGTNILGILAILLVLSLTVSGFGALLVGIARTPEQANVFGPLLNTVMAFIGGAFGIQLPAAVAQFSLIYWGTDAFQKLSAGSGDITLNLLVLLVMGGIMFIVGLWLFNRRVNI